ncbi:MAG TPA: PRC-barrel domain containing protein [Kiloniellaceae bacterium]|nr:PRC-barrel domain containing protein [Kiloniellaceae bacterium]HIP78509.1 PRC-barrel domain containing protein [Kiloniellaceae bacterium]
MNRLLSGRGVSAEEPSGRGLGVAAIAVAAMLLAVSLQAGAAAAQSAPTELPASQADSPDVSTARDIQGMSIWDRDNELLGEVDDVILDRRTSKLRLVLVSQGGFLGIGGKPVAIEWRELEYDAGARLLRTRKLTADELAERQPYETDQSGVSIGDLN